MNYVKGLNYLDDRLSEADRAVLLAAFEQLDWQALGNFGRNRQVLIRTIRDIFGGGLVTPLPNRVTLDSLPRDGPIPTDLAAFAKGLAAEFFERMKVFGEKFDSSVFYDPECSAHTKRGKTVHGYGVQFLADLKFGLIWAFAVFPAGDGFRPQVADWALQTKQLFNFGPIQLTSDREYTIAKAIHQWQQEDILIMVRVRTWTARRRASSWKRTSNCMSCMRSAPRENG